MKRSVLMRQPKGDELSVEHALCEAPEAIDSEHIEHAMNCWNFQSFF